MVEQVVLWGSLVLIVVILASILGAVERREKYPFVAGIALFIVAHAFVTSPEALASALAVLGILLALGSAAPLLVRQDAA